MYWPLARGTVIAFQQYNTAGNNQFVGAQNFANVLFNDGAVRLIKAFNPPGDPGPAPATFVASSTKLEEWMIRCPVRSGAKADSQLTIQTSRWMRGRALPF